MSSVLPAFWRPLNGARSKSNGECGTDQQNDMKHPKTIRPEHVGQDFDEFLADEGIAAEMEARAIKKLVVVLLGGMGLTQAELAQRLDTSRTQVRRLLDPDYTTITLNTLQRAAEVAWRRVV